MKLGEVDVLIIGAGPAGLGAAAACRHSNLSYRICEIGERLTQRNRSDPSSLVQGTGGAGLYSDGKFSFFPSASQLWQLEDPEILRRAYQWFEELVSPHGLTVPRLDTAAPAGTSSVSHGNVQQKRYNSQYLPFDVRARLIGMLEEEHQHCLMTGTRARLLPETGADSVLCEMEADGSVSYARSRTGIVFAGGRHGPLLIHSATDCIPMMFRYVELGVRIEQTSGDFFLRDQLDLDPKLLVQLSSIAGCRTFCCCREGEAVATRTPAGILSFSGRADVGKTGKSNVGFNVRTTDEALGSQIWREYQSIRQAPELRQSGWMQGHQLVGGETMLCVSKWLGPTAASMLLRGLEKLLDAYEDLRKGPVRLLGPCVEGIGWYPAIDRSLRVTPYRLWVAGDATGIFRGLTASFVSGYYAGIRASREAPQET